MDGYPLTTVHRLVEYLYTGEYDTPASDEAPAFALNTRYHFALADKYLIDVLKGLSSAKFAKELRRGIDPINLFTGDWTELLGVHLSVERPQPRCRGIMQSGRLSRRLGTNSQIFSLACFTAKTRQSLAVLETTSPSGVSEQLSHVSTTGMS